MPQVLVGPTILMQQQLAPIQPLVPFLSGGKVARAPHSDLEKRKLLQRIIDNLSSVVFGAFPELPLRNWFLASDADALDLSSSPSSSSSSWGMFGSLLGIAHLGDALESIGDGSQLKRWQSFSASILRMQLASKSNTGPEHPRDQQEPAGEGKPTSGTFSQDQAILAARMPNQCLIPVWPN